MLLNPGGVAGGLCDPDEIPEPPDEAVTQPGDLWILGNHRLLCSDSSKPEEAYPAQPAPVPPVRQAEGGPSGTERGDTPVPSQMPSGRLDR